MRRVTRGVAVIVVTVLLAAGCTGSGTHQARVDWDLRHGHEATQAQWHGQTAFELRDVRVRLRLPAGKVFDDQVDRFGGLRDGQQISELDASYPPTTVSRAHSQADRLGKQWHIDMRNIDTWYEQERAHPHHGGDIPTAFADGKPIGAHGPIPTIEVLYSFDDAKPVFVQLEFFWEPPGVTPTPAGTPS